jgi:hypothetical protein
MLNFIFILVIFVMSIVWFKYRIDKNLTIKEIKIDRDRYRKMLSNFIEKEGQDQTNSHHFEKRYNDLKIRISNFTKDVEETDFDTYPNIKEEFISSLRDIEIYGDTSDSS